MDYVITASELYQKAKEILNSGMDYVAISLMEPDNSCPDDPLPADVHFEAFTTTCPAGWIDFDEIDVVDLSN